MYSSRHTGDSSSLIIQSRTSRFDRNKPAFRVTQVLAVIKKSFSHYQESANPYPVHRTSEYTNVAAKDLHSYNFFQNFPYRCIIRQSKAKDEDFQEFLLFPRIASQAESR